MALLEREGVLAELAHQLTLAVRGQGRLVLLRGEAGVGKSAVLGRFAGEARSVADVLVGACDPLSTPRPLGPLVDIAPGLGSAVRRELSCTGAGSSGVAEVFRCVMAALAAGRPKTLILEDVHWADEATLDLICLLGRRIESRGALLVASYRDDEVEPNQRLRMLLGALAGVPAVHRVAVEPLSPRAVARLAAGRRIDVDELYRVTGGNPFFVTEVLAVDGGGVPATVADAVAGRLSRVPSPARGVAEVVAVIGSPAPVGLVASLVAEASDGIGALLAAGLLKPMVEGVGFRHELARMAVLEAVPFFRRRALHGQVLERLRDDPEARQDGALLAHHAAQAGDREAVLRYAPAAAAHAARVGAHREAAEHYACTLRFGGSLPVPRRAWLLERLGRERFLSSQLPEAIGATRSALELRRVDGDAAAEGADLRWLSFVLWPSGRSTESRIAGRQAVQVLERLAPRRELAWAYANMCQLAAYDQAGVAEAARYARQAISLGERFQDAEVVGQARFHLAATRYLCGDDGQADDGWAEMDRVRAGLLDAGLLEPATFMAMLMGLFATLHRDNARAGTALDLVERHSLDHDIPTYLLVSRGTRAYGLVHSGRWGDAAELATVVLGHPRSPPIARILPLAALALIRARRGEPDVWPLLDEALDLAEPTGWIIGPARAARAEVAWLEGDVRRAQAEARRGLEVATPSTDPWVTGELARWVRVAGGTAPAVRSAGGFTPELAGDWRSAVRIWTDLECGYDAALARLAGDVSALVDADRAFESVGARTAAAITRSRLRATGARNGTRGPRAGTRANPYGLTTRQLEVLELVRAGLTGSEIARRLHISPKTADHHVTAILAKMDVRSRTEAVRKFAAATNTP
jgi:DNA-binding CsgD family transcriptional regulator